MEYKETFDKLKFFVKTGIVVLSLLVLAALGLQYVPSAIYVSTSATSTRLPINSVNNKDSLISLSFDINGGNYNTEKILEILSIHHVKATFFVTGEWVSRYPDELKAIATAGHDIGNNSESHLHMTQLSKQEIVEEILQTHTKVKELTGTQMNLFRAPFGEYNNTLLDIADDLGYQTVQWNIDSKDWKDYGENSILKEINNSSNLDGGSIILLHTDAKYTADALEALITGLQESGYNLVPISQLIYTDHYYLDEEGRQFSKHS